MATWKKVVVSGSNVSFASLLVDNLVNGVVTGSANGTLGIVAINGTGNIVATTAATNLSHSGSFSGSFQGSFSGTTDLPDLTQGTGIVPFTYDGSGVATVAVSGAAQLNDNALTKWNSSDGKFVNSSLTDNGSAVVGTTSIKLSGVDSSLTGSFTGSFKGDGSGLEGLVSTLSVTGSDGTTGAVNLKTQGLTITGAANEINTTVSGQTVTVGLRDDVTITNNLTVNNNLTVLGTASFQNATNLEIRDRFVLLASGSNTTGDGGLVVQQGTQDVGEVFAFDSGTTRWGVTGSFNAASSSFVPQAFMAAVVEGTSGDPASAPARYVAKGNLFIGSDESIWIYS